MRWEPGCNFGAGDIVEFEGNYYRVIQPHTAQSDWVPSRTPTLWERLPEHEAREHHRHHHPGKGYNGGAPEGALSNEGRHHEGMSVSTPVASLSRVERCTGEKVGLGLLGTVAAGALGAFAVHEYKQHETSKTGTDSWERDAAERQRLHVQALSEGRPLPPVTWLLTEKGTIPQGAIRGGQEANGTPLYIARVAHEGGIVIGKTSEHLKAAHYSYADKEHEKDRYEILLGYENAVRWQEAEGHCTGPHRYVEGGREADGRPLYIGQGLH
ncbi:hypothetical protein BDK51DRAFT_15304, partial [Blyttiomyces helicus]